MEKLTPEIIRFNYYPGSTDGQFPERYEEHIVGQKGVLEIREHAAAGDGDRWYWDVHYECNSVERIFYPHQVFYQKTSSKEPSTPHP
jgi:hypothetical protein